MADAEVLYNRNDALTSTSSQANDFTNNATLAGTSFTSGDVYLCIGQQDLSGDGINDATGISRLHFPDGSIQDLTYDQEPYAASSTVLHRYGRWKVAEADGTSDFETSCRRDTSGNLVYKRNSAVLAINLTDLNTPPCFAHRWGFGPGSFALQQIEGEDAIGFQFVGVGTWNLEHVVLSFGAGGGTPTDQIKVKIYQDNGNNDDSGTLLGTSNNVTITASANNRFTFSTPVAITNGTTYNVVAVRTGSEDVTNYSQVQFAQNLTNYPADYGGKLGGVQRLLESNGTWNTSTTHIPWFQCIPETPDVLFIESEAFYTTSTTATQPFGLATTGGLGPEITFTPEASEPYLVLAWCEIEQINAGKTVTITLDSTVQTPAQVDAIVEGEDGSTIYSVLMAQVWESATASETVVDLKVSESSAGGSDPQCQGAGIVVLRLNQFADATTGYQGFHTLTTASTWEEGTTATHTPAATGETVIIGNAVPQSGRATGMGYKTRLTFDGTAVDDPASTGLEWDPNDEYPWLTFHKRSIDSSGDVIDVEVWGDDVSGSTEYGAVGIAAFSVALPAVAGGPVPGQRIMMVN